MKSVDDLRDEAARCRRLSAGMSNRDLAAKLLVLADEFETAADDREEVDRAAMPAQAHQA